MAKDEVAMPMGDAEMSESGRWRAYDYKDLVARDKASLDISWLRDESLEDSDNLPPPGVIAAETFEDLEAALEQIRLIRRPGARKQFLVSYIVEPLVFIGLWSRETVLYKQTSKCKVRSQLSAPFRLKS